MDLIQFSNGDDVFLEKKSLRTTLLEHFLNTGLGNNDDWVALEFINGADSTNGYSRDGFCVEYNLDKTIRVVTYYNSFEEACRAYNEMKNTAPSLKEEE